MMPTTRTPLSVSDPEFVNAEHTIISMKVVFKELSELGAIPFGAIDNDCEEHGRYLYIRAMKGEFGPIKPYLVDLEALKTNLSAQIDASVTQIGPVPLGEIELARLEEARLIEHDDKPNDTHYPLLALGVPSEGSSIVAVGKTVRGANLARHKRLAEIERTARAGKDAIKKAPDEKAARKGFEDAIAKLTH